jgi:hypothetical protein
MSSVAVAVLAGTSCGTIVSPEAFRTAGQTGQGGGLSIGGQTGGGAPTPGGPTEPATGGGGSLGGIPTTTPGGPSGPVQAALGPGITATTIYIGAGYVKNQEAGNEVIGGGGAGGGDIRDAYNVVIKDINDHGGIAGRKLVPIYAGVDATSTQTVDQQLQASCAKWTQDNKVFVILGGQAPVERECAKAAGAVQFWAPSGSNTVPETFQQYPHFVEITGLNLVRLGPVTIDGLAKQGYFSSGARIGIVSWDDPAYREGVTQGLIPALRAHGLGVATQPVYVHVPENLQDIGGSAADVNSAVLRFSTQRISHVLLLDGPAGIFGGAGLGFEFLNRAKAQQYTPRYGFNDNNLPVDALESGLYPPDQLRGSISVSWLNDQKSTDAGWHPNAARERCEALMRKNGVDMSNVNAHAFAIEACDELWFFQTVTARMGSAVLSADNFMAAVNALGTRFGSPGTYSTRFAPTRHDGVAAARIMKFVDSCTCYRYVSDPYAV